MKRFDKILLVAVVIALGTLAYSPSRAFDIEPMCVASEAAAQMGRKAAIRGQRSAVITMIRANFTGRERDVNLKIARWGFTFYLSTPEQLKEAFMESCMSSMMGSIDMPEVDER